MFRFDARAFADLPRARFLEALRAEGIPASGGYSPLDQEPVVTDTLASRAYARLYGAAELARLRERNQCPQNQRLCAEAVWLGQRTLLGPESDMDQIAEAIDRIRTHAADLVTA
jgi:perosamine synthetase